MMPLIALLFEFVILGALKATGINQQSDIIVSFFILIYSFVLVVSFYRNRRLRGAANSLTLAYFLRLVLIYLDLFAYPSILLPNAHSDEEMFFSNAVNYAMYGVNRRGRYPQMMGTLFRLTGISRLYGQYVSMLFSIVALVFFYYTLSELDIKIGTKRKIFKIICILPNYAILSSLFMREAVIYMILAISFYYFAKWIKSKRESYFLISLALIFPAAMFHSGTIAILVGYIAIRFFYDNARETAKFSLSKILVTLVLAFIAVYIIGQSEGQFTGKFDAVESLADIANTNNSGGSSYARYVGNSNNPLNFILYTPARLFFFLFSPLPGLWRGIADVIAFCFSSLIYIIAILNVIKFLRIGGKKNRMTVITLSIVALAAVFVFAWGTSNAGTATRHRDKMLILFAILWALSLDGLKTSDSMEGHKRRKNWKRFA